MTERNATESTTPARNRLKTAASARWNDERSAEMWGRYADDVTQHDDRQAWEAIITDVVGEEPQQVLDVGTGAGFLAGLYAGVGHDVVGCDFSESMLDQARERAARDGFEATFTAGDAEALPFEDASFDVVTNRVLIWSLAHPGVAVREWHRVLRPGGQVVLFGNHPEDPTRSVGERAIRRLYGLALRVRRDGAATNLDDRTQREWNDAKTDLPFRHAPPSKIQALFDAAGFHETRVLDVAEEFDQWRTVGPWNERVPWHVVTGHKPD
ncbi:class I SAM-dependent methyltransferase [Halomarina ordinaria]|uniref:Class I SAM-dependent methyltransferase n=1 Tax=Halomarina ordinaria TaxID=3033939 RepID=A0ABD5UGL5_9EURY|nr:class I SAM-dependent methyltransferase [Halomarina sp. PSRA2]